MEPPKFNAVWKMPRNMFPTDWADFLRRKMREEERENIKYWNENNEKDRS